MHIPVMFEECMEYLNIKHDGVYVDATLGGGGHSQGICKQLSAKGMLIGIDTDKEAVERSRVELQDYDARVELVHGNFVDCKKICNELGIKAIDGALMDLGCSSFQLDEPSRGFSYMSDARLDMRLDKTAEFSAYDLVNTYSEEQLEEIIRCYGEERWSARIAEFIVRERKKEPISTTAQLVEVIKRAVPKAVRRDGPHPAKRTFQAIRIEVNRELSILADAVSDMAHILRIGGRLSVITFHSLEDRIVKQSFRSLEAHCVCPPELPQCICNTKPILKPITKKPIIPTSSELERNHRSRSAKLRVVERI